MAGRRLSAPLFMMIAAVFGVVGLVALWRLHWPMQQRSGEAVLTSVRFADLAGWGSSDPGPALQAFARSCAILLRGPSTTTMGVRGYAGTVADWRQVCTAAPDAKSPPDRIRAWFEKFFRPLEIGPGRGSEALFTGYYEPELAASRTRHDQFQTPIYGLPANLVSADLGQFRDALRGESITGCVEEHRLHSCPSRGEIGAHGLKQSEILFFAADPVGVFFLHIQGSGRVRLEDGSFVRVAYAGQNGQPYRAIGRTLVERGWLGRAGMSMQVIRNWLHRHPQQAREVMETDRSYVFFKEQPLGDPALGSSGSQGVPLTPGASIAIDPHVHPYGVPIYVAAKRPDANPDRPEQSFNQLLIAQDSGGAIHGPARGDVFWGFGKDAESIAGRMKATGRFFVLLPKAVAARLTERTTLTTS